MAGKKTLAVRLGRSAMRGFYILLLLAAFAAPAALIGRPGALVLLAAPLAIAPLRSMWGQVDGPRLNRALAQTAQLLLVFGVLFSIALTAR